MPFEVYSDITLDLCGETETYTTICAKQGDCNSRIVRASITKNGEAVEIDPTHKIYANFKRGDQQGRSYEATLLQDGRIQYIIPAWVLEIPYTVVCDISIIDIENKKISTVDYYINVGRSVFSDIDASNEENTIYLLQLIKETEKLADKVENLSGGLASIDDLPEYQGDYANANIMVSEVIDNEEKYFKAGLTSGFSDINSRLDEFDNKLEIDYQTKQDYNLNTNTKTIVGSINELNEKTNNVINNVEELNLCTINNKPLSGGIILTAEDIGALPDTTSIPSKTSDLENDSSFVDVDALNEMFSNTTLNIVDGFVSSHHIDYHDDISVGIDRFSRTPKIGENIFIFVKSTTAGDERIWLVNGNIYQVDTSIAIIRIEKSVSITDTTDFCDITLTYIPELGSSININRSVISGTATIGNSLIARITVGSDEYVAFLREDNRSNPYTHMQCSVKAILPVTSGIAPSTAPNIIYGTDSSGNQTTYNFNELSSDFIVTTQQEFDSKVIPDNIGKTIYFDNNYYIIRTKYLPELPVDYSYISKEDVVDNLYLNTSMNSDDVARVLSKISFEPLAQGITSGISAIVVNDTEDKGIALLSELFTDTSGNIIREYAIMDLNSAVLFVSNAKAFGIDELMQNGWQLENIETFNQSFAESEFIVGSVADNQEYWGQLISKTNTFITVSSEPIGAELVQKSNLPDFTQFAKKTEVLKGEYFGDGMTIHLQNNNGSTYFRLDDGKDDGIDVMMTDNALQIDKIHGIQISSSKMVTINGTNLLFNGNKVLTTASGTAVNSSKLGDKDAENYQLKNDNALNTTDKTIVGAINELNNKQVAIDVDDEMSDTSENPVQNKVVKNAIKEVQNSIPTKTSELTNDSNFALTSEIPNTLSDLIDDPSHRIVTDAEKQTWNAKQDALEFDDMPTQNSPNPVKSGGLKSALDTKANKSDIPTSVSELTNDSDFITSSTASQIYQTKTDNVLETANKNIVDAINEINSRNLSFGEVIIGNVPNNGDTIYIHSDDYVSGNIYTVGNRFYGIARNGDDKYLISLLLNEYDDDGTGTYYVESIAPYILGKKSPIEGDIIRKLYFNNTSSGTNWINSNIDDNETLEIKFNSGLTVMLGKVNGDTLLISEINGVTQFLYSSTTVFNGIEIGFTGWNQDFTGIIEVNSEVAKNEFNDVNFVWSKGCGALESTDLSSIVYGTDANGNQTTYSYSDFTQTSNIPTKTSDLANDSGFITNSVDNLANYEIKTNTGSRIELSIDNSTYVVSASLKNSNGEILGETQTIDLPLESVVVNGEYNETTKEVVLTLQSGSEVRFSVADLIDGLAPTNHASTTTVYGVASAINYGHVIASSTTPKPPASSADPGSETSKFARGDHVHQRSWRPVYTNGIQQLSETGGTKINFRNGLNTTVVYESGGNYQIDVPTAGATTPGVISTTAQTFAGEKTFSSKITAEEISAYRVHDANDTTRITFTNEGNLILEATNVNVLGNLTVNEHVLAKDDDVIHKSGDETKEGNLTVNDLSAIGDAYIAGTINVTGFAELQGDILVGGSAGFLGNVSFSDTPSVNYWDDDMNLINKSLALSEQIPTKTSQLTNDSGFVTNFANNTSSGLTTPNDCTQNGFYHISNNANNLYPFGGTARDYRVLTTYYSSTYIQQIATDYYSDKLAVRCKNNGTWSDWSVVAKLSDIPEIPSDSNYSVATYNSLGLVKPAYTSTNAATLNASYPSASNTTTPTIAAKSTTSNRYYAVESDINGVLFVNVPWQNTNTNTVPSAYCTTSGSASAKTATCSNYVLKANSQVHVLIAAANTSASALTLNINSKGAKPIYINGTASSASNYTLPAGTYIVYYDGTRYYFRTDGGITVPDITIS